MITLIIGIALGIFLGNLALRLLDYAIYQFLASRYQKSMKQQLEFLQTRMLQEAEPGIPLQSGVN